MLPSEFMQSKELCKGVSYLKNGKDADLTDCDCCCIIGAVCAVIANDDRRIRFQDELRKVIKFGGLSSWNDRPETTKEMALAALRETERRLGLSERANGAKR